MLGYEGRAAFEYRVRFYASVIAVLHFNQRCIDYKMPRFEHEYLLTSYLNYSFLA